MSIAHLLQPELNKLAHVIHTNVHEAFGLHQNFPLGEILYYEETYGMLVEGAILYPDDSCLVYIRDPEDNHGTYHVESLAELDSEESLAC